MHEATHRRHPHGPGRRVLPEPVERPSTSGPAGSSPSTATPTTKLAPARGFASQTGIRDYLEPDFVLATARYWSRFGTGKHAEPLEIIRDAQRAERPARPRPRRRRRRRVRAPRSTVTTRVLVTGAGGPAGVAVIRSLLRRGDVEVFARRHGRLGQRPLPRSARAPADRPARRRRPRSSTRSSRCARGRDRRAVSTVDVELPPLAARRDELRRSPARRSRRRRRRRSTRARQVAARSQRCDRRTRVPQTDLLTRTGARATGASR